MATVTSKGQVTLPRAVRDALGLQFGSEVDFEIHSRPLCQGIGEGRFKVETSPFSRLLAGLCESSLERGVAAGVTYTAAGVR
jgi:AbrB family looped-hinge helix DNA binding protein